MHAFLLELSSLLGLQKKGKRPIRCISPIKSLNKALGHKSPYFMNVVTNRFPPGSFINFPFNEFTIGMC